LKIINTLKSGIPVDSEVHLTSDGPDLIIKVQIPTKLSNGVGCAIYGFVKKISFQRTDVDWDYLATEIMEKHTRWAEDQKKWQTAPQIRRPFDI
jgi:hypothetical protein